MWYMWDITSGMGWWWVFGGFWVLLFWGGLIALIVWAVKKLNKGEITRKEFGRIKKDLS